MIRSKVSQVLRESGILLRLTGWYIRYHLLNFRPKTETTSLVFVYRNWTWISWGLFLAFGLIKEGQKVVVIYSRSDLATRYPLIRPFITWLIRRISQQNLNLDNQVPERNISISKSDLYRQIAYEKRIEESKVPLLADLEDHLDLLEKENLQMLQALHSATAAHRIDNIYTYSGIISTSATILKFGKDYKIKTVTFEGWSWKPGLIIYGINKPSLEFEFRPQFNADLPVKKAELMSFYHDYVNFIEGREISGYFRDFHHIQSRVRQDDIPTRFTGWFKAQMDLQIFLIATNMIGDSATLGREKFFESQEEWFRFTVKYFLKETEASLIIRIHPAEEWQKEKLKFSLGSILMEFEDQFYHRIYPIFASEKFNTLSLVPFVKGIFVWTSTVGADFAAKGIPVMTAARSNYEDFDFAVTPSSLDEFTQSLIQMAKGEHDNHLDEEKITQARGYFYYLLQQNAYKVFADEYNLTGARLTKAMSELIHKVQNP